LGKEPPGNIDRTKKESGGTSIKGKEVNGTWEIKD